MKRHSPLTAVCRCPEQSGHSLPVIEAGTQRPKGASRKGAAPPLWYGLPAIVLILAVAACATPISVQFAGAGGQAQFQGKTVSTYPYFATVAGGSMTVLCDDVLDSAVDGQTWMATATNLGSAIHGGGFASTRFGGQADAQAKYEQAAWLMSQLGDANAQQSNDIQFGVWSLFDTQASASLAGYDSGAAGTWVQTAAAQDLGAFNFADFDLYSPLTAGVGQEIMAQVSRGTETPEPLSLLLLGTGLLGLAAMGRHWLPCQLFQPE